MSNSQSYIRKIVKVVLWVVLSFVLLFVIIAGLIKIPAIQKKIVLYATSFVSNKTHTRIDIKTISISFPKSVVIEGLYLEDTQKDTLLYAGKAKINMTLLDLLKNKITVSSISMEGATLKLYSTLTDPLLNYNFLFTAFSDTTNQANINPETASKWTYSLDQVKLKNIRIHYHDEYNGMNVLAVFKNSEFNVDDFDIEKSIYQIDELFMEGLTANVMVTESANSQKKQSENILPKISAKSLQLNNSTVNYTDSVGSQSVNLAIDQCKLEKASIDIQTEVLVADYSYLSKSKIWVHTFDPEFSTDTAPNNWKVTLNQIDLVDNTVIYKSGNKPELKNGFDSDHLEYNQVMLEASNFFYSSDKAKASIRKFSAVDQNNFVITRFETDFSMDQHSITAKNLKANTTNSSIDGDLSIQYASFSTLMDSMQFNDIDLNLKNLSFRNSDILYFNPELVEQPFFKNSLNVTSASGMISGQMNNLSGKNLAIRTGTNSILETDFNITGLPHVKTASYDFPNLKISSGKKDIETMAGAYIPASIELPENINLQVVFKGQMKSFESTINMGSSFGGAKLIASVDANQNFNSRLTISNFDLGSLLKDTVRYGPVSLTAEANGQGLDLKTIKAKIEVDVKEVILNKYAYHNLKMDGKITGKQFEGKIILNDEYAVLDVEGLVNLNPGQERYKLRLNVRGANLQKLNFTKDDIRIGLVVHADFKGRGSQLTGNAGITNTILIHEGKKYMPDTFLSASVNEPIPSESNISNALIGITYTGTVSPADLLAELSQFINHYFPVPGSEPLEWINELPNFNFEVQLHNHPIFSEVLFPQLKEFAPGIIRGSYEGQKKELKLNATMQKIVYGTTEINDFSVDVNSDNTALNYNISSRNISNSQIKLDNFLFEGKLADQKIVTSISSTDEKHKKLLIRSQITKDNDNYKLTLDPKEFYLMDNQWNIAADNYIEFGNQGILIHHLFMNHAESQINIASAHDQFNDDLNIAIKNFRLDDISGIIEKDSSLVKGNVDGTIMLKRVDNQYGLVADAKISNLVIREIPIGNLTVKAGNPSPEKFDFVVNLSGTENNLTANGYYITNGGDNSINIKTVVQSLSLKTVEAFSMGQMSEASGTLTGNFLIEGKPAAPIVTGELVFNNAFIKPSFLNNRLELKHETIELKNDGIYFKSFTLLDANRNMATINGAIQMKNFKNFLFDLHVVSQNFLLFNTTRKDNNEFYGRMVIDSKVDVTGPMALPVVNAKVKMKKGSNFTFAVPEDRLTTDKGEDVVEFENSSTINSILFRTEKKGVPKSGLTGFDLSSIIEIDKQATLRLLMDPASTDSLVVKGEAALSFTMDRSGEMSLAGAYNLNEGSYLVSLESVIKKKFAIDPGSTIIWNGDPLGAEININARYSVRASPFDLVADQISGLSDMDKSAYKQRYPFLVILKLRGEILHPIISFEIQLAPEDKGILGGAVNQKLNMLNEDESALNKQVFALLVLGRFVQENPFQTESAGGASTLIRTTVGKFLSQQLNQLSSKIIPGMELSFDIQSYDDYQTGQAKGRTQVEVGLKKQLFNERLSIQLGGTVDVEGEKAKQNSASDITSDVTVEYKLTKDGRYRLKGFRHNQYEGAIEGQLVETGIGVVFVQDFNSWRKKPPKSPNGDLKKALHNK